MEFGRRYEFSGVDFALPSKGKTLFFDKKSDTQKRGTLRVFTGAPIWTHKEFVGKIYPKGCKPGEFLHHFSQSFNCIEFNSSFYALPSSERISQWCEQVAPDFRFCPKVPKQISHESRSPPARLIADFVAWATCFEAKLGMCFLQFPPELAPRHWRHLLGILDLFPRTFPLSVELRHPDWFSDKGLQWLGKELCEREIALVVTDTAGRRDVLHHCFPMPKLFLRFSGDALRDSDFHRLEDWSKRLRYLEDQGLEECYFILHQQNESQCVELAEALARLLPKQGIREIRRVQKPQLSLF